MLSKHRGWIAGVAVAAIALGWFGWNDRAMIVTHIVQEKVRIGLYAGLSLVVRDAPRISVSRYPRYYRPNLQNPNQTTLVVYEWLLYDLNSDLSAPMTKVTQVSLVQGARNIDATATVQFDYLPGIRRTISVSYAFPDPFFAQTTGSKLYNGRTYHVPPYQRCS